MEEKLCEIGTSISKTHEHFSPAWTDSRTLQSFRYPDGDDDESVAKETRTRRQHNAGDCGEGEEILLIRDSIWLICAHGEEGLKT
jgi:hypothetical protein